MLGPLKSQVCLGPLHKLFDKPAVKHPVILRQIVVVFTSSAREDYCEALRYKTRKVLDCMLHVMVVFIRS